MIEPISFLPFTDDSSLFEFLKQFKFTQKAMKTNSFKYKGFFTETPIEVKVVGRIESGALVIETPNGLHTINGSYLLDMQKNDFDLRKVLNPEGTIEE